MGGQSRKRTDVDERWCEETNVESNRDEETKLAWTRTRREYM